MSEPLEFLADNASIIFSNNRQSVAYVFGTDKGPILVTLHRHLFADLFRQTKNELSLEVPRAPELGRA